MKRVFALSACAVALSGATAAAQPPAGGQAPAPAAAEAGVIDPLFAAAVADGGLAELTIAQLGVRRATDPRLKQFSERMVQDHTRTNEEMMALAARKGITLPRALDPRAQFCGQSLAGLSGAEFDRCYAKAQLVIHLDSVATFEAEAQRGQDPDVKAFAARWLPHIQEHLRMIEPIARRYEQEKPSTGQPAPGQPEHR